MLKIRIKQKAATAERAVAQLAEIQTSIALLNDEDLLDFADIFAEAPASPLKEMAAAALKMRNISL
jgi:hypothetical protein